MTDPIWQGKLHFNTQQIKKDIRRSFKSDRGIILLLSISFVIQLFTGGLKGMERFYITIIAIAISCLGIYFFLYKYFLHNKITYSLYLDQFIIQRKRNTKAIRIANILAVYSSTDEHGYGLVHIQYYDPAAKQPKEYIVRYLEDYQSLTDAFATIIEQRHQ
ncbi:MAG: hypothetical protein HKN09_13180 [Saprospiraceae bacterium]|nr:hypothetical protein [Saprospiraceae bacterium]